MANDTDKDELARNIAQKRSDFIKYLYAYFIVNGILWVAWWFTDGRKTGFTENPWPAWIMLGWGIGMVFKYFEAYRGPNKKIGQQE